MRRTREAIEKMEKKDHIRRRDDEYVPHKSQSSMTDQQTSGHKNQGYL
ncbi:MAG: hypothetical protein PF692_15725 [Kiritimatiellae bacterium]|nr:hypothetical protein [Kiritimatiellia bacterium]